MKKYIVFLCLLIQGISYSQTVDIETAETVSKNFFVNSFENGINVKDKVIKVKTENLEIESSYVKTYHGHNSYYVTNFKSGGWVITSSHKAVGPILAYSEQGSINQNIEHPAVFTEWMLQYEQVIDSAYIKNKKIKEKQTKWLNYENNVFEEKKSSTSDSFLKRYDDLDKFYLLDTEWGQAGPNYGSVYTPAYNYLMGGTCSVNKFNYTGKYLAGCTAVAIAQILKYWEFSYGPFADFDWWNMPDELDEYYNPHFETERYAISKMILNVGNRINSNYGCDQTGALPLLNAKNTFVSFGYVENDMDHNLKSLHTYNQWINLLKHELDNNRPVQYNSKDHSFVCDGYVYGTNDFHFNFGWNGLFGGSTFWYNFEDIPTDGSTLFHECLTGIHPNWQSELIIQNNSIIDKYLTGIPLFVTYQAKKITIAGNNSTFTIKTQADARFLASESISLLSGFWVQTGGTLLVKPFANSEGTLKSDTRILETEILEYVIQPESDSENVFVIYPNPSNNGMFKVSSNHSMLNNVILEVTNMMGQTIYSKTKFNINSMVIDISSYPKGIYTLKISYEKNIYNYKIINQ